jgi:hypothetical protein
MKAVALLAAAGIALGAGHASAEQSLSVCTPHYKREVAYFYTYPVTRVVSVYYVDSACRRRLVKQYTLRGYEGEGSAD